MTATRAFTHRAGGIDWYCELRGSGPPLVLIPSGEGDCGSFARSADLLADTYTVLTFDMPGFSRSSAPPRFADVTPALLAEQVAALLRSLGYAPAIVYGCSSGGQAVLSLIADQSDCVRAGIVHEAALMGPDDIAFRDVAVAWMTALNELDDDAVIVRCRHLMREILSEDASAWDALGPEYLQRVDRNFVTWVRHYVGPGRAADRSYSAAELRRRPLIWTVGGYSQIWLESGNFRSAARAGIEIEYLRCRHFPQITLPFDFAAHLRASAARLP